MLLWILRPVTVRQPNDDPWELAAARRFAPSRASAKSRAFGFVVRAETEEGARELAHQNAGDENRGEFLQKATVKTKSPWLDKRYSTCEVLRNEGEVGVIMQDFVSA